MNIADNRARVGVGADPPSAEAPPLEQRGIVDERVPRGHHDRERRVESAVAARVWCGASGARSDRDFAGEVAQAAGRRPRPAAIDEPVAGGDVEDQNLGSVGDLHREDVARARLDRIGAEVSADDRSGGAAGVDPGFGDHADQLPAATGGRHVAVDLNRRLGPAVVGVDRVCRARGGRRVGEQGGARFEVGLALAA